MSTADRRLDRALYCAHDLARALAKDLDRARDRAAKYLAGDLRRDICRDLDCARDHASKLIADLDRDLDGARARAWDITDTLEHTPTRDLDRALDYTLIRALDTARDGAGDLRREIQRAYELTRDLYRTRRSRPTKRVVPSATSLLATAARFLLAAAARLLPATDRGRYAEEYQAELWDLAQAGAGRVQQLRYALRQFRNVVSVRVALRSPRRRSSAS